MDLMFVARIVRQPMVEATHRHRETEVGGTAATPRVLVVQLAPGVGPVAAVGRALVVGRRGRGDGERGEGDEEHGGSA